MERFLDDDVQPAYADAPVMGEEQEHISADDLYGVQTKLFYLTTPDGATLEQLANSAKDGLYWDMPDELKQLLKPVNKTVDRTNVSEKDLEGDLGKALFLSAKVVSYYSDAPKRIAVDIEGLVPTVYTDTGRHNWVIPANCPNTVIGQPITEPNNIFTRHMYAHNQKCDLKTLQRHIRFDIDHNKQVCGMDSKGIGWKVLMDELNKPDCIYADAIEAIYAKNQHIIDNPDSPYSQIAQVPYQIGEEVYESIAAPLRQIEKAYIDFGKWKVKFSPADKKAWNSVDGLIRDAVVLGADHAGQEAEAKLNTPFSAGILLELKYVMGQ